MRRLIFSTLLLILSACSSQPVLPEADDVKVSRDAADEDCKDLGLVEGRVSTASGTKEQALEDMKADAAKKGANYVKIETMSAMGTAVRGRAFVCD